MPRKEHLNLKANKTQNHSLGPSLGASGRRPLSDLPFHRPRPRQLPQSRNRRKGSKRPRDRAPLAAVSRYPLRAPSKPRNWPHSRLVSVRAVPLLLRPHRAHPFARQVPALPAQSPLRKKSRRLETNLRIARRRLSDLVTSVLHFGNFVVGQSANRSLYFSYVTP